MFPFILINNNMLELMILPVKNALFKILTYVYYVQEAEEAAMYEAEEADYGEEEEDADFAEEDEDEGQEEDEGEEGDEEKDYGDKPKNKLKVKTS